MQWRGYRRDSVDHQIQAVPSAKCGSVQIRDGVTSAVELAGDHVNGRKAWPPATHIRRSGALEPRRYYTLMSWALGVAGGDL